MKTNPTPEPKEQMTNKEKAQFIIKDIRSNHLPRFIEGLDAGYIDENQLLVIFDHAVRARVFMESDGSTRVSICPQCHSNTVQPNGSGDYCEECGWPNENRV